MFKNRALIFHKIAFTALLTPVLTVLYNPVVADTYVWGDLNGVTDSANCGTAPDSATVIFTMLQSNGNVLANNSLPDILNSAQTPTCGTFTYNTVTQTGSAEIAPFDFFSSGPAVASGITVDLIPDALDLTGIGEFFLANMLFSWNGNVGIPVSLVWDAQAILAEMDGTPASFTLNNDGTINTANPVSGTGAIPASDGTLSVFTPPGGPGSFLGLGPQPLATKQFNTTNIVGVDGSGNTVCVAGADADYSNNTGGGCMQVNPSADIAQSIIADTLDISTVNPTQPIGVGGNPMVDGPFTGFNANFEYNNMKLVSFTDTTDPVISLNAHVTPAGTSVVDLIVNVDTYTEPGATCADAAPLDAHTYTVATPTGGPVDTLTVGTTILTYTCTDASGNSSNTTRTVNVKAPDAVITLLVDGNGDITPVTQECAVAYVDAGATCSDPEDGNILGTANPLPNNLFSLDQSNVDTNIGTPGGPYAATWSCQDNDLNASTQDRDVNVVDTTGPVVTPNATDPDNITSSTADNPAVYNDQGAVATDTCDTTFPINILSATLGTVTMTVPDTGPEVIVSNLQYTETDADGNSTTTILTVNVTRSQPVITLLGGGVILNVGETYVEQGMDVADAQDGSFANVTSSGACGSMTCTVDSSTVDTNTSGSYTVTYDVVDGDSNNATQVTRTVQVGIFASDSNFTMLNPAGDVFGGTNDVAFDWDQTFNTDESDTNFGKMTIASVKPQEFFGFVWTAHHVRVYGPGTYTFDTTCTIPELEAGDTVCNNPLQSGQTQQFLTMTVDVGQVGAHILFDWNTSSDIDVVNVWDVDGVWDAHGATDPTNKLWDGQAGLPPDPTTTWKLVSTDVNGDNKNGAPMVDGPFQDFYANFNAGPAGTTEPVPPYQGTAPETEIGDSVLASINLWGLFAGLITLLGLRLTSKKK